MSATATLSNGRRAATRPGSRRWWCTGSRLGLRPGPPPLLQPGPLPGRAVRSSYVRAEQALADDPAVDLSANTTDHLIADMERLRVHLGIGRWLLRGMSWGSTLLLAYAQRYPHRVSEIVISGVTMTRRSEIDWLYRGLYRFFPQEWERFRAGAGEAAAGGDLIGAYGRLMADPDPLVRARAAADWSAWEDATISLDPDGNPGSYSARPPGLLLARLPHHTWPPVIAEECPRTADLKHECRRSKSCIRQI